MIFFCLNNKINNFNSKIRFWALNIKNNQKKKNQIKIK